MLTNTKIALAVALLLSAGSAVLANDIETNPSTAQSAREWQDYLGQNASHGSVASPSQKQDLSRRKAFGQ
jgi:hypothetical protein